MSTARDSWLALPEHTTVGTWAMPGRTRAQSAQKVFSQPTKLSQVIYDAWIWMHKQTKNAAPAPPPRAHLIPPKPGLMLKSWSSIRSSCSDLVRGDLVMSELRFRIGLPQRESGRSRVLVRATGLLLVLGRFHAACCSFLEPLCLPSSLSPVSG